METRDGAQEGTPLIPKGIIVPPAKPIVLRDYPVLDRQSVIRNPEKYVLSIESHQGSHGSKGLVRAVLIMRDAGRTMNQTFEYLRDVWNKPPRVIPPWGDREIAHAIERHFQL